MKVNIRSTVALTLAALAFGAATATAHNTLDNEYQVSEVDTETVDCTDTSSLPEFSVQTFYSTHVHQSVKYTLPSGGYTLALPTEVIGDLTSLLHVYSPTKGQQIASATTSTSVEQPTVSSAASTASTSTREEPIVSTVPSFTSTKVQSTFVSVPVASEPVPAVVPSSSAEAHSEASTEPAPATTEQPSSTKEIVPPVVSTETPLTNPLRPSVTPSDTPTTASITLTTTETLPGAPIPPVKEGVSQLSSEASEAIIQNPHKTHGGPPIVSVASSILSMTTETLTNSHTTVVTVIESSTQIPFAVDCFSTTYVTVYSSPSSPASVATAHPSYTAIAQPSTIVVATGVPHPSNNTTTVATGVPRPNNTTTTGKRLPPIHGAAPTLSATPGILLAFCGLICYLI
ncbi:hypothetical protein VC83_05941 [Pseudogymnoascus destructans]|uniref:Uncharacterized protein n=2 Tax=Pseudogymnoascus destructans TaxID=655981 RepID=L8G296_PSED2|nr:uncharacterized protein VC83_05941 [Pseudogymnoascus destructans]ELR06934.1 hypothetical protein GMDG_02304 [Pseudogymnoascus destructans 20631-21]OAF57034.1 hypothetical protein VC83_05941 [Pseudogymnoascus destructans]